MAWPTASEVPDDDEAALVLLIVSAHLVYKTLPDQLKWEIFFSRQGVGSASGRWN
jgi:hypothetical protein